MRDNKQSYTYRRRITCIPEIQGDYGQGFELRKVWNNRFSSKISWESFLEISVYTIELKEKKKI